MERKFTWISYVSLLLSFIPVILSYLIAEGIIGLNYFTYVLPLTVILSLIISIISLRKKAEK
ncbi:hypothetical protein [Lentibacillus sp. JNUCC-1]|uniref:hypothetical protein n=1 Tax=Lentibacillus sp. JNUCC-1 TaxID=2654513 RepID=UPI0018D20F54|nr:hypothetical protein [Lentibacillus sp. JNUCC-1]